MQRHFDRAYREASELRDGTAIELRLVRESDEALFRAGFERLSETSRYRRFHTPKPRLTPYDLHYLTHIDQEDHFALGAVRVDPMGREEPLGVARFVRVDGHPEVAEAAITVLDDAQGLGLGNLLLLRLIAAARERGIERFRTYVLADNREMRGLMHYVLPGSEDRAEDGNIVIEAPLPDVESTLSERERPHEHWTYDLMRRAAAGTLEILGDVRRAIEGAEDSDSSRPSG